ncbi:sugar 3,4-ketoisomerase [Ulvibacterium sp.]|uniref:sugar 3,4-ketoisomerase n=1 Tax=Ulvibacterium sp. TaxID=2665914 RepID=UPI003BAA8033
MGLKDNTVDMCFTIEVSKVTSIVGDNTMVEDDLNIPFEVKRIYHLYGVPTGEKRGGHAHYELEQYILAVSGSFDVIIDDGVNNRIITLNRSNLALHIVPGIWRELENFSSDAICLVIASHKYDEGDYIRDYKSYLELTKQ